MKTNNEDNHCIECKPEDLQESPHEIMFCLKCGKVLDTNTTHNEEKLDFLVSMLGKGKKIN